MKLSAALLRYSLALVIVLLAPAANAATGDFFEYHTTNIQLLKGWNYQIGPEDRSIATFEHFNRWRYGDFFMFADGTHYDKGGTNIYAEFSPRLSLGKISGQDLSFGIIKDVLISTTEEVGKHGYNANLYGGAVDLDLPGFKVASINLYRRDNPALKDTTWQTTICWKRPFEIDGVKFVTEGFADIAGREGPRYHANQFVVPRLLVDIGDLAGGKSNQMFAGIEYQYWHNKFGRDGVTESVPQLQLKWVFD